MNQYDCWSSMEHRLIMWTLRAVRPLVHAAIHGYLNILEFLVSDDWTACSQLQLLEAVQQAAVASSSADNVEVLDFLLDMSEVMIDSEDTRMRETPLVAAASRGSKDYLDTVLFRGASVNAESKSLHCT